MSNKDQLPIRPESADPAPTPEQSGAKPESSFADLTQAPDFESHLRTQKVEKIKSAPKWQDYLGKFLNKIGLGNLLKNHNQREVDRFRPVVDQIKQIGATYEDLSDEDLQGKTAEFRERFQNGEDLDSLLPEAYAAVREASRRVLGLQHYDEQLMGGIALHQGRIAEMQTGQGKTITAMLPAYLDALTGKGVHVITANDYLAERDKEQTGQVYEFMGLSVGLVAPGMSKPDRKKAYAADITYGTNSQFGFDYLRDNLATSPDGQVQRGHAFAVVDEVDSILIDDARTPMIIAGEVKRTAETDKIQQYCQFANEFVRDILRRPATFTKLDSAEDYSDIDADYVVDEKSRTATLTSAGIDLAEKIFGDSYQEALPFIEKALAANGVMKNGVDYLIEQGKHGPEVVPIDSNTGRPMQGRRFNDGLHEAIEAKEGLEPGLGNSTRATISVQNYYRMYDKLSGMTGTGATEKREFAETYALDVVTIPKHGEGKRNDLPDQLFDTEAEKHAAILDRVRTCLEKGQPVLIGTTSVKESKKLYAALAADPTLRQLLEQNGRQMNLLNAENHKEESKIIAQAGRLGSLTIATNMAGRGTDIILGGTPKNDEERDKVVAAGGLFVIGAERNSSRRVDNQLRGRAARQDDPGESQFFISRQDHLLRIFSDRSADRAQSLAEDAGYQSRKHSLKYDDIIDSQRSVIFEQRQSVLSGASLDGILRRLGTDNHISGNQITAEHRKQLLQIVDNNWIAYLDEVQDLRRGIGLRSYASDDPVEAFRRETNTMYNNMLRQIDTELDALFAK